MIVLDKTNLNQYIHPHSVAIVGASEKTGSIGNTAIKNFADLKFKGKVFGINPRYDEVEGFPCFASLSDIPEQVDVVIIAVASHFVEKAIHDCVKKKVKFVVIFSSGFAEKGQEGLNKQNELLELCRRNGIRVVGPNTLGAYNIKEKIFLSFTPASTLNLVFGEVGIVSQSGATGGILMNMATEEKIGFTYMLTTGNQMDLNTLDFLEFLVEDQDTKIIASYLEGVPNGQKLRELAERALSEHKPIIILKSGRSEAGQRAALSHTASLTGSSKVFDMVANRHGLTLVNEMEEMIDAVKAFRCGKRPKGNRIGTVVISGATGIMLADKLEELHLEMSILSQSTQDRLSDVVPSYCSVVNPVDIGQTLLDNPVIYKHCIETLVESEEVDILILHLPIGNSIGLKFANDIIEIAKVTDKPIIVMTTGTEHQLGDVRKLLNENNVPAYNSIKSAAQAANYLVNYENSYNKRRYEEAPITNDVVEKEFSFNISELSVTEPQVKNLLNQMNIPVPKGIVVKDENEILGNTKHLKYPLVAKIVSPQIPHKSDAGGVVFPIKNEKSLIEAFRNIINNAKTYSPHAKIEGVLIEEMVEGHFLESIIGVRKDPIFGPVILCGLGGIYVEVMKDVSQRLAPISKQEALEMIQQLKSYPLFKGVRNGLTYDVEALAQTLVKVSQLAMSMEGSWTDLEINPLIVFQEGNGVMALDGLITNSQSETQKEHVKG